MKKLLIICLLFIQWSLGQDNSASLQDGVQLIDFHYADVTDVQHIPDRNEIYSSDASGKVIVYDSNTNKYKFTFLEADGVGVHSMLLLNKNRLIIHKAYASMDGIKPDSLFAYDVPKNIKVSAQGFKVKLLGNDIEEYGAFSISKGYEHGLLMMKRDPFETVATLAAKAPVVTSSSATDGSKIAFVEEQYGRASFVVKAIDNSELYREDISEFIGTISSFKVLYEDDESVLLIINNSSENHISIYRYSSTFEKELAEKIEGRPGFKLVCETTIRNGTKQFFLGTNTNSYQNEYVVGTMKNGTYNLERFKTDKNFCYSYFSDTTDKITFYSLSGDLSNLNKPITRYHLKNDNKVAIDGTAAFGDYKGFFLASGDLLFLGNSGNENEEFKLFTAGTLQNKFAPFTSREYLKRNHDLDLYDHSFIDEQIDPLSSSIAVLADYKGKRRIVSYNFTTERVGKLCEDISDGFTSVVTYDGKTSQVVLSKGSYKYGGGYVDPGMFKYCSSGNCKDIKGSFKYGQFSRDGNYLLTVTDKSTIQLRALPSLKILTEKQLEGEPKMDLNYSDTNEFEIALDYTYKDGACYLKHISLVINDNNYDFQERDCLGVKDAQFQNGIQTALLNFVGVLVGDQLLETDKSTDPSSISLNADGSKILVNYNHGLIELFDTSSKKKQLSIIQPDYNSHLFVDQNGNYITNFKADKLVIGYLNGNETSLNVLKSNYYKPSLILEKLGPIDAAYAKTLAKAEQIREEFTSANETSIQVDNLKLNETNSNSTNQLVNTFSFESADMDIKDVAVYLNGVEVQEAQIKQKGSNNFEFKLELADIENTVELKTKSGTTLVSKEINYSGSELNPNLYVLAVGVSNYQQSKYNLTFASKDALDIAQLYGNLSKQEIADYQNEYYGDPLFLADSNGKSFGKEAVYYEENMFSSSNYIPASSNGMLWIELGYQKAFLHNFETGERHQLDHELFGKLAYGANYIIDPDGKEFLFYPDQEWYRLDLIDLKVAKYSLPLKDESLNSDNYVHLENNSWLEFDSKSSWNDGSIDEITLTTSKNDKVSKSQFIQLKETYNPELVTASKDGIYALIKTGDEVLHLYNIVGKESELVSTVSLTDYNSLDKYFIVGNDPTIYRIQDYFKESRRVTEVIRYNKELEVIGKESLIVSLDYGMLAYQVTDQGVVFLNRKKSKAINKDILTKSIVDLVANKSATAASFRETQVSYLLNEEATKSNILKKLKSLQKKVRPQDQIVVFLAGHGVLDQELNYYYAPNDMDFEQVKQNGVSFDDIINSLNETQSTKMLLLMDTCHSGNTLDMDGYEIVEESVEDEDGRKKRGGVAATTSNKGDTTTVSQVVSTLFDNFTSVSGVTVISASSGQDVAYESNELSNGAFTTAYISYLQEQLGKSYIQEADYSKPLKLSDDFIKQLRQRILDYTNNKQQLDIREINELSKIRVW